LASSDTKSSNWVSDKAVGNFILPIDDATFRRSTEMSIREM
jgi:hypothetical protein